LALSSTETECRFLEGEIGKINDRINILYEKIQKNIEILDGGMSSRIRVRIEDNIFNQLPPRDEAEILTQANRLRQEIRDWQSEISQLEAERSSLKAQQRSLDC